ncbi:L-ribulose-5-phosphate 4-epimerase [Stigmatella aurantiaca]|uniref:L-ribulose-5-phosphate 4-epimerase n=2 Tax=Stigmatella aurantiaca TaxID=41 RepID=Q08PR0_STIAD|nr:L-ribulose-5-phosphate 4-epimerase [Stigmatella aurantiaca]ADO69719.1 L-ribulose-phosphate 4-epimerase [Stigmatella aurantiaca DW4/3-1]EAU62467.1 putative epimerase-aldolase [Stigmatella aurantiaca DW4/3-1]
MGSKYRELKERAWEANREIPRRGLAIFTFGNVSALDSAAGVFAIKPSGVAYDKLSWDDMVVVDLDGKTVEGTLRPSSDTKTHMVLYRNLRGLGGIAHTHSTYATGWAQARLPIPLYGTTHADHLTEDIPCTAVMSDEAVERDYELETGNQILECFRNRNPLHTPMVLVAGHAPFAWGESAEKAVYNAGVLEEIAKMAFITRGITSEAVRLPDRLIRKHFERKHGKSAYYGQK